MNERDLVGYVYYRVLFCVRNDPRQPLIKSTRDFVTRREAREAARDWRVGGIDNVARIEKRPRF